MNDAKHTKGPWIVGTMGHDTDIDTQVSCLKENEGTDKEWTAIGVEDADGFSEVIALAHPSNARLITAAPELLEACKLFIGVLLNKQASASAKKAQYEFLKHLPETWAYIQKAKVAIAKAEGR